jgi:uncharacterized RDD family membrane protein YckC
MQDNKTDINSLELGENKTKMYSFVVDDLLVTFITILMLWTPIQNVQPNYENVVMIMNTAFIQIVVMKILYQTFFVWYYGATLGKMMFKLRVIDYNHFGKITFIQSFLRASGRIVSESIFYLGFMLSFYTQSKQTLHDKLAKTLVVNA